MAVNPSILCLQDIPDNQNKKGGHKVVPLHKADKSTDSSDNQTLIQALVAMVQLLTMTMTELSQVSAKEQQNNNTAAQLNVLSANNQAQQAAAAEKKLEASEHQTWEQKALYVFLHYVLPLIIVAVTTLVLGPVAGAIALGVALLTMPMPKGLIALINKALPPNLQLKEGTSLLGFADHVIAEKIGQDEGWSPETIQAVEGGLNLAFAFILAVAGGFGAAAGTAAAAETVVSVAEDAVSTAADVGGDLADATSTVTDVAEDGASTATKAQQFASNAGKVIGVGAFASQVSNTNCFYDIIYGSWASANPADKDKAKEIAGIISAIINVIVGIIAVIAGGGGIANSIEDASTFNSLAQKMEDLGFSSSRVLTYLNNATRVGMAANAGLDIYQGVTVQQIASQRADLTKIMGQLRELLSMNSFISRNSNMINNNLKANLENIQTLLQGIPDFGAIGKAEAQAMIKINQQA